MALSALGDSSVETVLKEAAGKEGKGDWMAAAQLYDHVLASLEPDRNPIEGAKIAELSAECYFKGAFQSGTRPEFIRVMTIAGSLYEKAASLYEKGGLKSLPKKARARSLFAAFWAKDDPSERRGIIDNCVVLAIAAAEGLDNEAGRRGTAGLHYDLLTYAREALNLADEHKRLLELFELSSESAWKAVNEFQGLGDEESLLETLHSLVFLYLEADHIVDPPRYQDLLGRTEKLRGQIAETARRIGTPYATCLADELAAFLTGDIDGDMMKAVELCEAAAKKAEAIRDSFMVGRLYTGASSYARWAAMRQEYVEKRRELFEKVAELAAEGIKSLEVCYHGAWLKVAYSRYAESYTFLAQIVETEVARKRVHLQQAIEIARKGMVYEDHAWKAGGIGHELSKAVYFLATLEENPSEKAGLLGESLRTREETVRMHDLLSPHSWSRGVMLNYFALVKAELSSSEQDSAKKIELLQDAISEMQLCVDLCTKWATTGFQTNSLASFEEWYGDILLRLYGLAPETITAQRAVKAYQDALALLTKAENPGPIAPVRWKIAQAYDALGNYKDAAHAFSRAAEDYRSGVGRVPGLASALGELASYMDSWSLIEEARLHHDEEQYSLAAGNYDKVAASFRETKSWSHLSKHYAACSFLENGETLSRQEKLEEATGSFSNAVLTFQNARRELEAMLEQTKTPQEKHELQNWLDISGRRETYGLARKELEEAKILDRKGEEEASAKYRSASTSFNSLIEGAGSELTRRELETLMLVSEAWAKMKEAEASASPEAYAAAADSFAKVEKVTARRRFRLLALANASMCRALQSGTIFRRSRDTQLYSVIKRLLETAADYYQEAGFNNAADWTRATQRLFDALVYLADAEVERERAKRTELFHLADRHLQLAARLYGEAGFHKKREEALKHLKRVREEKEILLMPVEALSENPAVSEATVAPVSLIRDRAFGLERFETANVVANLNLSRREMHVGEEITFDLEISNSGRTTATLLRLENVVPQGFMLDTQKIAYRVENGSVNMRGKRLDYLGTTQVKIALKAAHKGNFGLGPRIVFADDKGNHRTYELEPVALSVSELGILRWIKGPGR